MAIAKYLLIIFLAPTFLLLNFHLLVFNKRFYQKEFSKLNVYEQFSSSEEVDRQANNLIRYLCCDKQLEGNFFSEREKLHLIDVKNLIRLSTVYFGTILALVSICLFILVIGKKINLAVFAFKWGSLVTIASILVLSVSSLINFPKFEKSFDAFHRLTFDNNLWQLPPEANLLKLFPQQFFVDFANRLAYQTIGLASAIFILAALAKKYVAKVN